MSSESDRKSALGRLCGGRSFDAAAEDYDVLRPGYPRELIRGIVDSCASRPDPRVLEIGCGTGQASLDFARRGMRMTCLEPGRRLAAIARRRLSAFPEVQVLESSFEEYQALAETFDMILAATSFHWVDPRLRWAKAALLLRVHGILALLSHTHPRPFTGFFERSQEIYRRQVPEWCDQVGSLSAEDLMQELTDQLRRCEYFHELKLRSVTWSKAFTRDEYLRLLGTYSDHSSLAQERKERLLLELGDLIDGEFEGIVHRPYRTILCLAGRVPV